MEGGGVGEVEKGGENKGGDDKEEELYVIVQLEFHEQNQM